MDPQDRIKAELMDAQDLNRAIDQPVENDMGRIDHAQHATALGDRSTPVRKILEEAGAATDMQERDKGDFGTGVLAQPRLDLAKISQRRRRPI